MKLQTLSLAAIVMLAGCSAQGDTASQQRASIQKMRSETLNKLYALQPEARSDIQHAKGYAVFANNSSKILLFGFGSGYGVVRNKATGKDTYMKMAQGGAGLGMGIKQQRTVLVFHDKAALETFIRQGYMVAPMRMPPQNMMTKASRRSPPPPAAWRQIPPPCPRRSTSTT
ncbi:hypothetical protein RFE43_004924 [Klebsiella variicola]|nr:hypothetical protein [Klebsiella variicola]